jgi:branched-chain amino acid transport system permease protein
VVRDELTLTSLASWGYLALAAVGLTFAVGLAGMPSLAQGALLAVGAVVAGVLRADGDWPPLAAAAVGAVAAAVAGGIVGAAVGRVRPAFVAVATWLVAWLVARALVEFPAFAGGAEGRIVPQGTVAGVGLGPAFHWELAVVLVALGALGLAGVARGQPGAALGGLRERPAAALALGVPALRLRTAAFAAAGLYAGLAGALSVQLDGIADPAAYSPVLSFTLFVAVLLGGARSATGAVAGTALVGALFWLADRLASSAGVATGRLDTLFAAALLLGALAIRSETAVPSLFRRRSTVPDAVPLAAPRAARLEARGLEKSFAGEPALTGFDLVVEPGVVTALVGPNGSGKTTALRLLAGTLAPDGGSVLVDGAPLPAGSQRTRALAGIVRTLQATQVFGDLTVLDNARVGAGLHVPASGVARALAATPRARAGSRVARGTALTALREVGLDGFADREAGHLTATDQRLLMLAAALAAGPRVLLVDEPAAGAATEDVDRLAVVLARIRDRGIAVLVVEHNLRLVGRIAERVVVLDAGRTIAAGPPAEVGDDPAVRAVYLGQRVISPENPPFAG